MTIRCKDNWLRFCKSQEKESLCFTISQILLTELFQCSIPPICTEHRTTIKSFLFLLQLSNLVLPSCPWQKQRKAAGTMCTSSCSKIQHPLSLVPVARPDPHVYQPVFQAWAAAVLSVAQACAVTIPTDTKRPNSGQESGHRRAALSI